MNRHKEVVKIEGPIIALKFTDIWNFNDLIEFNIKYWNNFFFFFTLGIGKIRSLLHKGSKPAKDVTLLWSKMASQLASSETNLNSF